MTHEEYDALPGIGLSALLDLRVSPLRFWHLHINPDRPVEEPTKFMTVGSALHCAVLEPDLLPQRYAPELLVPDGALVTIEDMRSWLRDRGLTPKGTRKAEIAAQVRGWDRTAVIFDALKEEYYREQAGKTIIPADDWANVLSMTQALRAEPKLDVFFSPPFIDDAAIEICLQRKDPETGVDMKGRLDYYWKSNASTAAVILDLKTFSQQRGKSIDKCVTDAIWWEAYYLKAYFYSMLAGWPAVECKFILAFVESQPPHEVRLRRLIPNNGREPNLYWSRAAVECRTLIRSYATCQQRFGSSPWKSTQEIETLTDDELPMVHL